MKTAVEWLVSEVAKNGLSMKHKDYLEIIEKALEMEEHQRQEDTNYGYSQGWDDGNQNNEPMKPEIKDLKTKV
jgi:hypothetical protein